MNLVREASCCKLPSSNLIYYTRPADMMHKVACYHCMHVTALLSVMVVGQDQTSVAHPMYYIRSHLTKSRVSDPLCFSQTIDWISRVWHGKKPLSLIGLWCNSNVLIAVVFTSYLVMSLGELVFLAGICSTRVLDV